MSRVARLTPSNGRVAHASLIGEIKAERYTEGDPARVVVPVTDLRDAPGGARQRQLIFGDAVLRLETRNEAAFVWSQKDGYAGYVDANAIGPARTPTHWVSTPATHLYTRPEIKAPEAARLSFGARVTAEISGDWASTPEGLHLPARHLAPLAATLDDPVTVADLFLGTPYLWGGNSRDGIDCSGLVQAALMACGTPCPPDSDLQTSLGHEAEGDPKNGDLLFWRGHVAIVVDETRLLHANAHHMAVAYEGIAAAIARISAQGDGAVIAHRRIAL